MMADEVLYLYKASTGEEAGEATPANLDVDFPPHVDDWTDVLDCREEPYTEQSIAENCAYAQQVHKKYILVGESQIAQETPPVDES